MTKPAAILNLAITDGTAEHPPIRHWSLDTLSACVMRHATFTGKHRHPRRACTLITTCILLAVSGHLTLAQDRALPADPLPPPQQTYMGRQIAQTMHYTGAEWLIRDVREREERCSLMLANLGAKFGLTVCDMGCGNGFYSLTLAKMVGPNGRVLAVDIQPEMLAMLRERAEKQGIENITPILGSMHDPRLPIASVDLILLVDVYHEFSYPERMLAAMRRALKPQGLIVLVEYRAEDPEVPILPLHKMSKEQIMKELPANGFRLAKEFEKLPWQHMMFFARDEQWTGE